MLSEARCQPPAWFSHHCLLTPLPSPDPLPCFFSLSLDLPCSSSEPLGASPPQGSGSLRLALPGGLLQSLVARSLAALSRSYSSLPFDVLHSTAWDC